MFGAVTVSTSVVAEPDVPVMLTVPEPDMTPTELAPVTAMFGSPDTLIWLVTATFWRLTVVVGSSVKAPVPSAALLPTMSVPLVTVVPPE